MLQSYKFPIKNVIYSNSDNSEVKVIYEDDTFNYTLPTDQVILGWININQNTISAYVLPAEDINQDTSHLGYVGPSEES